MSAKRPRRIYWVDAFTQFPFNGNPAVVLTDAEGLGDAHMQKLAREVNCSETAFILPATLPEADLKLRWFTPTQEINLCGHATIAAIHTLVQEGRFNLAPGGTQILYLETRSGLLSITVDYTDSQAPWIWMTLPPCNFQTVEPAINQQLLDVLRVPPGSSRHNSVVDSTNRDVLVAIDRLDQLHQLQPDFNQLALLGQHQGWRGICVYTTETVESQNAAHTRFFAPQSGINEDPVTGSVSGPLALHLYHTQHLQKSALVDNRQTDQGWDFIFEQGDCLDRPGRLKIHLGENTPKLGGQAVTIMHGELHL